jgi:hypothetical protein
MKIGIVTAMWLRPEVFKMFAKGVNELYRVFPDVDIECFIAGSEGNISKDLALSTVHNCTYIERPNNPLATKMNAALSLAKGCDYVLCVGSDDIIHPELLDYYIKLAYKGYDFIGVTDFYFYDTKSQRFAYWGGYRENYRKGVTCGAGRFLSASLLNKWNWEIWNDNQSHILDSSMELKLNNTQHSAYTFSLKEYGLFALDIKSGTNMTPFELWDNTEFINGELLKTKFNYVL